MQARGRKPRGAAAGRSGVRPPDRDAAPAVARQLLAWYRRARRDLPWRSSADPYRVWVSEVMLQQTQVERVKEFFVRFMDRYPTVADLAAAAERDVLGLWEGLGYYRRARQLHAAARRVVAEYGGRFPRTVAELRGLPGIGRYTAAAIASIAFDEPEPIVEANSRRVIARLVGHSEPLDGPGGDGPIWEVAATLVPRRQPGQFNQALMDLGALVCTPQRPLCRQCPLERLCVAARDGLTETIPARRRRRAVRRLRETVVVVRRGGRVLVERRGPEQWWEGLWDFPRAVRGPRGRRPRAVCIDGVECGPATQLGRLVYTVTHHRVAVTAVTCVAGRSSGRVVGRRWVTVAGLSRLAMTAPARRIAGWIADTSGGGRRGR